MPLQLISRVSLKDLNNSYSFISESCLGVILGFGATYIVLYPEHPIVDLISAPNLKEDINSFRKYVASLSNVDRTSETKSF